MPHQSFARAIWADAWTRSQNAFSWRDGIGVTLALTALQAFRAGLAKAISELWTLAATAGLAAVLYALVVFLGNLVLAPYRVWSARNYELDAAEAKIRDLTRPKLTISFDETTIDRSNAYRPTWGVTVASSASVTVLDVAVTIESLEIVEAAEDSTDRFKDLNAFIGIPLMTHGDPDTYPRRSVSLHPGEPQWFDVVAFQADSMTANICHAIRRDHRVGPPTFTTFVIPTPTPDFSEGIYRIALKAQGRDVPATRCILIIDNVRGAQVVRRVG